MDARSLIQELQAHSFAVVPIPEESQRALEALRLEATRFFLASTTPEQIEHSIQEWRTIIPGEKGGSSLIGFNSPSSKKALFRYYRSTPAKWPNEDFRFRVVAAENALRRVLVSSVDSVLSEIFPDQSISWDTISSKDASAEICDPSPFDLFWYYNSTSDLDEGLNCDPHVDRGYMHVVVSSVPGLEVFDVADGRWKDPVRTYSGPAESCDTASNPSISSKRAKGDTPNFPHAVLLVNSALHRLSLSSSSTVELPACIHRVVKHDVARLSMSLELRSKED